MQLEDFFKLNCQLLIFYRPGLAPDLEIYCAQVEFFPKFSFDSAEPCIIVHFDWEDEKRSGAPMGIEHAMTAFEFQKNHVPGGTPIEMRKLGSNSVLIEKFSGYNFKVTARNSNAKY